MSGAHPVLMTPTAWITAEKLAQQLLWLLLFVVLAPILGPKPYGLFSLTMVVIGFCELVLAEAAAEALLSLGEMSPAHLATANLCNLGVGLAAAGLTAAAAAPLAQAFGQAALRSMFYALSPLPVLSSLVSSPTAVLKREMRFGPFAARSIVGLAIGGAAGVAAALLGAGVWALVIQVLVQRTAEVAILSASAPQVFRFGWRRAAFDEMAGCAADVLAARGLAWATGQAPRLVIGVLLGPAALGVYTLAARITDMVCQVVLSPVTLVARVELRRFAAGAEGLQAAVAELVRKLSFAALPVTAGLVAVTPVLFHLWLGQRWRGAEPAAQVTLLTVAPSVVFYCATAVLMGLRLSRLEVANQAAAGISSVVVAWWLSPHGLVAVCWALTLRLVVLAALPLAMLKRRGGVAVRTVLQPMAGAGAASLVMGLAVAALLPELVRRLGAAAGLGAGVALGAGLYALCALVLEPVESRAWVARLLGAARPPLARMPRLER